MSEFLKKISKKGFEIELEDGLKYPSVKTICDSIEKDQKSVEFISKEKPVIFKIEDRTYKVNVRMTRGGYMLFCSEI